MNSNTDILRPEDFEELESTVTGGNLGIYAWCALGFICLIAFKLFTS